MGTPHLFNAELQPNFDGGLLRAKYLKGGVRNVKTLSQRNAITSAYRYLDLTESTIVFVEDEGKFYKLINNPTGLTTNSDWEMVVLGGISTFTPVGTWDSNNLAPVLSDAGAVGLNGQFYFVVNTPTPVNVTDPTLFLGVTTEVVDGDMIVSIGSQWIAVSNATTWDSLAKPSVIDDYVAGIVQAHTHVVADITDLNAYLAANYIPQSQIVNSAIPWGSTADSDIVDVEFLRTWYYTAAQVDFLLGVPGSFNFTDLADAPSSYTGQALKVVRVKATEDGLEFATGGSGGGHDIYTGVGGAALTTRANLRFQNGLYAADSAPDSVVRWGGVLTEDVNIDGPHRVIFGDITNELLEFNVSTYNGANTAQIAADGTLAQLFASDGVNSSYLHIQGGSAELYSNTNTTIDSLTALNLGVTDAVTINIGSALTTNLTFITALAGGGGTVQIQVDETPSNITSNFLVGDGGGVSSQVNNTVSLDQGSVLVLPTLVSIVALNAGSGFGTQLSIGVATATFTDYRATKKGIEYASDYSATYTSRSLVDQAYVTSLTGATGAWKLATGGTFTGNNILTGTGFTLKGVWDALGTTPIDGYGWWLANTTAAAAGAQQMSPSFVQEGQAWETTGSASRSVKFAQYVTPTQGADTGGGAYGGTWTLAHSRNNGAYAANITVTDKGAFVFDGNIFGSGSFTYKTGGSTFFGVTVEGMTFASTYLHVGSASYQTTANLKVTQAALGSNFRKAFEVVTGAHTSVNTGLIDFDFGSVSYTTDTIITGSTVQYGSYFRGRAYAAGSALGVTTAYGMYIEGPQAGNNITIATGYGLYVLGPTVGGSGSVTNNWAAGFGGNVLVDGSARGLTIATSTSGQLSFVSGSASIDFNVATARMTINSARHHTLSSTSGPSGATWGTVINHPVGSISGAAGGQFQITGATWGASSGSVGYTVFAINHVINTGGTYAGNVIGLDINPTLTGMTGVTNYAIRSTSGGVLLAGGLTTADAGATITANTKLDVRGIGTSTNNTQRWADSANTTNALLTDNGVFISGISTSDYFVALSKPAGGIVFSAGTGTIAGHNSSEGFAVSTGGVGIGFRSTQNTGGGAANASAGFKFNSVGSINVTSGTHTTLKISADNGFAPASGNANFVALNFNHQLAPTGTTSGGSYWVQSITPTYSFTVGTQTVYGIDYNPTLTSMTGVTHYAFRSTSGGFYAQHNALGATQANLSGIWLANNTAAANNAQQYSPSIVLEGQGWKTTATAASQSAQFKIYVIPIQGTANPVAALAFDAFANGVGTNSVWMHGGGINFPNNSAGTGGVGFGNGSGPTARGSGSIYHSGQSMVFTNNTNSIGIIDFQSTAMAGTSGSLWGYRFSTGFSPASGTATLSAIQMIGTVNMTGGANGAVKMLDVAPTVTAAGGAFTGIDYNPAVTSIAGTHLAVRTTSGQLLFANSSGDAVTANTRLDVRGIGTTTALGLRIADSGNTNHFSVADNGAIVHYTNLNLTGSTQNVFFSNSGNNQTNTTTSGALVRIDPDNRVSTGSTRYAGLLVTPYYYHGNTGELSGIDVAGDTDATFLASLNAFRVSTTINSSSGTGTIIGAKIGPTYNFTGTHSSDVYGIYYTPTETSMTGVNNHYSFAATSGTMLLPASVVARAPLRIPHGTAPTSPVDGDIWTTSTSMYVRINGVTKDLNAGGGGGITNSAAANEMMKSDGTNAVPSGVFSTTAGDLTFGTGLTGANRTITADGSATDVGFIFSTKGAGEISLVAITNLGTSSIAGDRTIKALSSSTDAHLEIQAKGAGTVRLVSSTTYLGNSALSGVSRTLEALGSGTDIDLNLKPKGASLVYAYNGLNVMASGVTNRLQISADEGTGPGILPVYSSGTVTSPFGIYGGTGISGSVTGQDIRIRGGNGYATGNNNGGNTYISYGAKANTGKDGNVGLLADTLANWQSMERGLFVLNALTAPTGNPSGGIFSWIESGTDWKWRDVNGNVYSKVQAGLKTVVLRVSSSTAIGTGLKGYAISPLTGTIKKWYLRADPSATVTVDVWKANGSHPTNSNSITASAKPALSAAAYGSSSTLTGWSTSVSEGDIFAMEVETNDNATDIELVLYIQV